MGREHPQASIREGVQDRLTTKGLPQEILGLAAELIIPLRETYSEQVVQHCAIWGNIFRLVLIALRNVPCTVRLHAHVAER